MAGNRLEKAPLGAFFFLGNRKLKHWFNSLIASVLLN
jgi:hypothetical protein